MKIPASALIVLSGLFCLGLLGACQRATPGPDLSAALNEGPVTDIEVRSVFFRDETVDKREQRPDGFPFGLEGVLARWPTTRLQATGSEGVVIFRLRMMELQEEKHKVNQRFRDFFRNELAFSWTLKLHIVIEAQTPSFSGTSDIIVESSTEAREWQSLASRSLSLQSMVSMAFRLFDEQATRRIPEDFAEILS